ncbi:MAG: GTP-binding protein, partial [Spirochaetota bacterium]|nr:GTP-binding protein [Spirochaetota bacterium]
MQSTARQQMNIVIAGHVDHGKSTVIGRLLADTDSLPDGKLDQVKAVCARNSKPFEYAFLLDALKDEQSQGITIDAARVFFKTPKRDYIIIDAPGHIEFLKNMVTGASRAESALLVIDAAEGVQENSRRHGYMISMLGIRQIIVVVNKMDLVDYDEKIFRDIVSEYSDFLKEIDAEALGFIPASGMKGDGIAALSGRMPWYGGMTVLEGLDSFHKEEKKNKSFRMPVQDIYKFTNFGDSRRVVAGTVETGELSVGDEVVFYPSGKKSRVRSIEGFNMDDPITSVESGMSAAFTLEEQLYVRRGEIAVKEGEQGPEVSSRVRVNLFWLGRRPMVPEKEYLFKCGTLKIPARIEEITRVIDASNLDASETRTQINRHDVAECVFRLKRTSAFDRAEHFEGTGRFVIVDDYEITGGGIIREGLADQHTDIRDNVFRRNYKWEKSFITAEQRANRYNQKPHLVLITGGKDTGKKRIAKSLEEALFNDGKYVYFLGIGNLLYGVDADIKGNSVPGESTHQTAGPAAVSGPFSDAESRNSSASSSPANGPAAGGPTRKEHIRRLAEVAHLMMDSG